MSNTDELNLWFGQQLVGYLWRNDLDRIGFRYADDWLRNESRFKFHDEMVEQYGKVRRFLPRLLQDISVKAGPAGQITMDAFNFLAANKDSRKQTLDSAPLKIITNPWKRLVFDKHGKVTKLGVHIVLYR